MADQKISQLTASTTPLAGTEVLPIVQGGSTVKVSIDNLTKGKTVSATGFDTDVAAAKLVLAGTSITASGTDTDVSIALTAKGNGGVGVGTSTPRNPLEVSFGGGSAPSLSQANGNFSITQPGLLSSLEFGGRNSAPYDLWMQGTNYTGGAFPINLNPIAGDVIVGGGNLVIGTSGKGIDFSADGQAAGMTSELLDDYEEGTFTATLTGFSAAPTTPVTATSYYTKIGRQVTCQIAFNNVDTTGASGPILIQGMPFAAANTTAVGSCQLSMGTVTGIAFLFSGGTTIEILDATFYNNLNIAAGASKYAFVTITYTV